MKNIILSTATAILALTSPVYSASEWSADFQNSSLYPTGETIKNINGWELVTIDGSETDASVIEHSEASTGRVLHLFSSNVSGASNRQRTVVRNNLQELSGGSALNRAEVSIAWNYAEPSARTSYFFFGQLDYNVPAGFSFNSGSGISVHHTDNIQTTTLLSAELFKKDYFYKLTFDFDFDSRSFTVNLKGEDINGNPIDTTLSDLSFQAGTPGNLQTINGLFLRNQGLDSTMNTYVESIDIRAIPEPSTTLLLGSAILALSFLRKPRK